MKRIHCLRHGRALCGMPGLPKDWPGHHSWISLVDWPEKPDRTTPELELEGARLCSSCNNVVQMGVDT